MQDIIQDVKGMRVCHCAVPPKEIHVSWFPSCFLDNLFFPQDHGPCHAVDCVDKTVRVRNDAEAVERMLGQATIFISFHVSTHAEGLNQ